MFSDEQIKIAETFLGTAVTSGMLDNQVYLEMIDKIKREEEVFLPYSNVEDRLGISRMTIYRMVEDGELERAKVRGSVRITKSSLENYIKNILPKKPVKQFLQSV